MTARIEGASRAPWWVTTFGPIARSLLAAGVPLGCHGLITIRGPHDRRAPDDPRRDHRRRVRAPVDLGAMGRRPVGPQPARAGGATITVRGRTEEVTAIEQDRRSALVFFRDTLPPIARRIPFGVSFIRIVDGTDLADPVAAADGRPVFELRTL